MRLDHGISRRLVGERLTTEHSDGRIEHTTVSPDQLGDALGELGIVLTDEELDRLRDRYTTGLFPAGPGKRAPSAA